MGFDRRQRRIRGFVGQLLTSRVGSFSLIGIALTVFGAIFIPVAKNWGWETGAANFVQAIISIVLNFLLNYWFTWSDARLLSFKQHVGRFVAAKVATVTINQILFVGAEAVFRMLFGGSVLFVTDYLFAYVFSTGVITLANYAIMDTFVFGKGTWRDDAVAMLRRLWSWVTFRFLFKKGSE